MKTAVLVIDMQQELCEGPGAAFDCGGTISRINAVTRAAKNAAAPVIFIQHEAADELVFGTDGWQLAWGLAVEPADFMIRKTTPDAFLHTDLAPLLQALDVERVMICGMHTEFCVDTTTRRALALGYPVILVSYAHTSAGNAAIGPLSVIAHHNATLTNISSFGPRAVTVPSAEVDFGSTHPTLPTTAREGVFP